MNILSSKSLILFSIIIAILISEKGYGQSNNTEALLYNVGVGAFFSGVGAVINKSPEEKFGKVFLKGMAQGALGGYIVYESKNLVSKIPKNNRLEINWIANVVNSAGISIIENSALNQNFWGQWNLHIGFNRIEFHTTDKLNIKYRIMPAALLATAYSALGNKFEIKTSLRTGAFIFSSSNLSSGIAGQAIGPAIIIDKLYLQNTRLIVHELIHVHQYQDYNFINAYFKKTIGNIGNEFSFVNKAEKYFYYDAQGPFGRAIYEIEKLSSQNYYDNFIEREALYYSRY